jgi:hypothetical protein
MKVLLRNFDNEVYVWKTVKYVNGIMTVDGTNIGETNIVSVEDDDRGDYVTCSACGTILKKGSKEYEEHKHRADSSETCLSCNNLCRTSTRKISTTYKKSDDGRYIVETKESAKLACSWTYPRVEIESDAARRHCRYSSCKNATMNAFEDIFIRKPGIFDDIITVDRIIEAGYKKENTYSYGSDETFYALKGRNRIYAVVNKMNIVDHFRVEYKRRVCDVYYSKKYNEFYMRGRNGYTAWVADYDMSSSTVTYIKKKIAELYE